MELRIDGGKDRFYQWDTGQHLVVENADSCTTVHFSNRFSKDALVVRIEAEKGMRRVAVPNILLQTPGLITAYLYCSDENGSETRYAKSFVVRERPKPESYVYTETKILSYEYLDSRMTNLENTLSEEISTMVNEELAQAKASGEFDGKDGKTAYQYAQDGGYSSTEEAFAKKLAQEIPDAQWVATKVQAGGEFVYIPKQTLSSSIWHNLQIALQPGFIYDVTLNGKVYTCEARAEDGGAILGNNASLTLNDDPFCIAWGGYGATSGMFFKRSDISYPVTLKVTDHAEYVYDKMPEEYLPGCVVKSVNGEKPDADGNVEIEMGGGSASIDVTAQVGQTIVVEEVDANGKPTKWKSADYPLVVNEMIPKTTYTPQYDSAYGCYLFGFETETVLAAGQKYIVIFDGVEYPCTAKRATVGTMSATYIGNGVLAGNQTGEPFALMDMDGYDGYLVMANFDADAHSFSLMSKKLNDDYVPQSVYPYYIDVNFEVTEENPNVCNDTVANVEAIYATGRMIGVKMKMGGGVELIYYPYAAVLEPSISPYGLTFMFGIPVDNTMLFLVPQEDGTYTVTDSLDG